MKKLIVGQYEASRKQITFDSERGTIIDGVVENDTVQLQSGERVQVKDGRVISAA